MKRYYDSKGEPLYKHIPAHVEQNQILLRRQMEHESAERVALGWLDAFEKQQKERT